MCGEPNMNQILIYRLYIYIHVYIHVVITQHVHVHIRFTVYFISMSCYGQWIYIFVCIKGKVLRWNGQLLYAGLKNFELARLFLL